MDTLRQNEFDITAIYPNIYYNHLDRLHHSNIHEQFGTMSILVYIKSGNFKKYIC